jgi:hypothetical protein
MGMESPARDGVGMDARPEAGKPTKGGVNECNEWTHEDRDLPDSGIQALTDARNESAPGKD